MNSELQAQSDAIIGALKHLETTMHQDAVMLFAPLAILLILTIIGLLTRR